MKSILVISGEEDPFRVIHGCLHSRFRVARASSREDALAILKKRRFDILFADMAILCQPECGPSCHTALQPFRQLYPTIEVIVMTGPENIRQAVMAVKEGAADYLTYPITPDETRHIVENIQDSLILHSELDYLRDRFWQAGADEIVATRNAAMKRVFDKIRSVAPTKSTVLLIGETGTGKGVLARLIHRHSNRRDAQFISVHCGAIPETLIESELFGHEKGAFTGAIRRKLGKFEIARGGSIFLDEIGTIAPVAQIKLLQILQDGTFGRVGGEETIETNVRVIAATNTDLKSMCQSGQFRKDLYYRLNVFPIEIPPLRERVEDIPLFVDAFLKKLNRFDPKPIHGIHPLVREAFANYAWPGNIRELENLVERAYILETSTLLTPQSFPPELFDHPPAIACFPADPSLTLAAMRRVGIERIEREYLVSLLHRNCGKINESAIHAGISTRQLHKLMKKYSIRKEAFKN